MPVGCLINNAEGEITYWNPAAEKIFGFRADEVLGLNMDAKIIPAHAKAHVDRVRLGMVAGNQNIHSINQNLTKDGRLITCEWENTPLHSPDGRFRGFLAMVRDITEQQQLSQERDRLLERLQLVMESLPVAFMVSDPDLRVSYWNPAAERTFGFSAQEALGQSEYDLIVPPDTVPLVGTNIQHMITLGKEVRAVNENVTRDGRRIICEWINTPLVSADGQVQGLIAMAQDITEQRRIAQSLEESERRFRGIFEDTPIPIWFADFSAVKSELQRLARSGVEDIRAHLRQHPAELEALMASIRILDINPAAVEMHRAASKAELIAHFADIFMPESAPALVDTMALIAAGERVFDQETALRTLDGQPLWVMFRWQAALGHEDTADRVLISVVDVSQRKKNDADQARNLGKLQLLTQAAVEINSAPNLDGLLQGVVDWSRHITGAILASASLSENGGENQRIGAFSTHERLKTARLVGMQGKILRRAIFQTLFAGGKAARFSQADLAAIPMEDAEDALLLTDARIGGYLAVPVISQAGSHLGILLLANAEDQSFDASDVALATQLGLIAAAALEKQNLLDQLRQAEERMRELARQVVSAQEKERQQIARELHDETGQNLTALKLSLQLTAEDLPAGAPGEPGLQTQLRESINLVETIMNQTRELARMLRPPRLEALSLGASLEALCIDFSKRLRIPITYRGCVMPQLDDLMSLSIYRFVQEGLTNVARHSRANSAWVSLQCSDQAIQVSIEDDGQGFDRLETEGSAGIGLRGMQERIEMLNGLLRVESRRGQGSRLVALIPIEAVL